MDKKTKEQRAIARTLEPAMRIGKNGVTTTVVDEAINLLKKRKLIKIRLMTSKAQEKKDIAATLTAKCGAKLVDQIGNIIVLAEDK